jgi:xylulokinase
VSFVIGIDSSTTATKAVLVDEQGTVVATGTREYAYDTPYPGWSEQQPEQWWRGAMGSIRDALVGADVDGQDVEAVGLTGQMHGLVMLDSQREVIRPSILWNDQRTARECDEIRARVGPKELIALTGNDAMTGFTAPKIAWVRKHEPENFERIASIMLPKDYVRLMLTGRVATDVNDASGTLLLDISRRTWAEEMIDAVGLTKDQMPELHEGPAVTGEVTPQAASLTGLMAGTPVVAGSGDQAANAVGMGAIDSHVGALSLGTSGVVFVASDEPVLEPQGRVHAFCHAVPQKWHAMGVMLSAAGSLRWYHDTFAPETSFEVLTAEAATVPAGADGVLFLPYLTGERTPHADPDATGGFFGLTVRHTRAHLTRAVLEGVAYGLADGLDLMRASGLDIPALFNASGGGTRSPLWLQIIADVLDVNVGTVKTVEGAAFGTALLGGVGAGMWSTVENAVNVVKSVDIVGPGPDADAHRSAHELYRELYPALKDVFPKPR